MSAAASAAGGARGAVSVRAATREDVPHVHRMINELAAYLGQPDGCQLTVEGLLEDGFDSSPAWFFLLVAEEGEELVGYALCHRAYSSRTRRTFFVSDLYVRATHRRAGVGELLFREICRLGVAAGVQRIDWTVLETNAPALRFYERLGARVRRSGRARAALRLDRARVERLAQHH